MTKEEIGLILKRLRLQAGKTQEEVARQLKRRQQVISHWETGYAQPDANTLFEICAIYGVTVDEAFGFQRGRQEPLALTPTERRLVERFRAAESPIREAALRLLQVEPLDQELPKKTP